MVDRDRTRKGIKMQLRLGFECATLCLPVAYRHFVQSMIYSALRANPELATALHDGVGGGRQFKLFTFGQLEGKYAVRDKQICFSGPVGLEIRSVHETMMLRLLRSFRVGSRVRLGNNELVVTQCTLEAAQIVTDSLRVVTRSPIVAYITQDDGRTRFFSPEEEMFYTLITANAQRKWRTLYPETEPQAIAISAEEGCRFRKQVTMFKDTRITAWDGRFVIRADAPLLELLYDTGLGAKSSQGFGMFSQV